MYSISSVFFGPATNDTKRKTHVSRFYVNRSKLIWLRCVPRMECVNTWSQNFFCMHLDVSVFRFCVTDIKPFKPQMHQSFPKQFSRQFHFPNSSVDVWICFHIKLCQSEIFHLSASSSLFFFLLFSCFVLIYQKSVYIIEFTCVHAIEAGEMEWMCAAHTFMNDCSSDQLADSRRSFVIAVIC